MMKRFSIRHKITLLVVAVVLLSVLAVSYITYTFSRRASQEQILVRMETVNRLKAHQIGSQFEGVAKSLKALQQSELLQNLLTELATTANADSVLNAQDRTLRTLLAPQTQLHPGLEELALLNRQGRVLFNSNYASQELGVGKILQDPDGLTLESSIKGLYFSKVFRQNEKPYLLAGIPVGSTFGSEGGILLARLNLSPILAIAADTSMLGKSGETLLAQQLNNSKLVLLNAGRSAEEPSLQQRLQFGENRAKGLQQAVRAKSGSSREIDLHNKATFSSWTHIPLVNWGIVTKVDEQEVMTEAQGLLYDYLMAGALVLVICLLVAGLFSRILIRPLLSLKQSLQLLGKGVLPEGLQKQSNDEFGEMTETLNHMIHGLKNTANFAHEIGEGHFDADFQPISEADTLGNALIGMRDSIQQAEARDKERNWIVTGVAEIGDILRQHNKLDELGDAVIAYVTKKIDAIQGAFYVVSDDEDNPVLELQASYAYNKKKFLKGKYRFAEGLVGQSAIEQDTILRTEIPYDYVTITSGLLGEQRPDCILIVPLIANEQVYGVMEFAGYGKFSKKQVKFVEEISLITARTVFNIKVNERTHRLLDESQKMSHELQIQQEILRQNAEEMEATQEELKRTNGRLEEQIDEVNRTQKRMQLLLENASEVITIYESDATVRYISPSVGRILGYTADELVGKRDIVHVHEEYREHYEQMFAQLLDNPMESVSVQFQYHKKNGESVWLEASGTNLLSDPAIQGILVNTRDITERRRAEQEQRMRSQMQALSENSPDLITRVNTENEFFYINPVIQDYTGLAPEHFQNKNLSSVGLQDSIVQQWVEVLKQVKERNDKISQEIEFPSETLGDRIMSLNAIPEFNEEQTLESVLMVAHDITERKMIELEIAHTNKKINDSINYAQRIQGAILPDNRIIRRQLPDSFTLYKPRDVVSGDFPWYVQVGDDLFLAAVDCTGHGVPGALISLIGYFLLNDIVRSRKISNPGEILDALDAGVTSTLRQDEDDSKTKDGMDISLCKINLKKNTLDYAGAHRPLYFLRNGELEEVKGDRFPIGGGKFKNQTNFTNTHIKLQEGDAVYFCSDGFPDQFGGPENRKFGPKRLRDLIVMHQALSMVEQMQAFDAAWEEWRGEFKQTDDMLLMGIRF